MTLTARDLLAEFNSHLRVDWQPKGTLMDEAHALVAHCSDSPMSSAADRRRALFADVCTKFQLHRDGLRRILDALAAVREFPNYHQKALILRALNFDDQTHFKNWINARGLPSSLLSHFQPLSAVEIADALQAQLNRPRIKRSDAKQLPQAERREQVLRALFGGYIFRAFSEDNVHKYLNSDCRNRYLSDYFDHLLSYHAKSFDRECALHFLVVDDALARMAPNDLPSYLCDLIKSTYEQLSNHCIFAILVRPISGDKSLQWQLFSDLVLFAEKHREVALSASYFHPGEIEWETRRYIPGMVVSDADFNTANEGFAFRDCIINWRAHEPEPGEASGAYDLLLLFEKNLRDESPIPCPACRSLNVSANSYPVYGVRSWECRNSFCPERSAFDRGNRFSIASLLRQRAIDCELNQIPEGSLRRWKLDFVVDADLTEIAEMLVRHYTLHGDTVVFTNVGSDAREIAGRRVRQMSPPAAKAPTDTLRRFKESSFFARFVLHRGEPDTSSAKEIETIASRVRLLMGDCYDALAHLPDASIDGAVTSPPYYNAREYSTWPNIYCYLYDMFNSSREVFRVLKPGAYYLFNIFDYFDNECTLVRSAMGQKRMILGAYIIDLFRRAGFEIQGNTIWYKGEIEGKRNYNQGNRSPYYQQPLNCWEHVLIFRKPGPNTPEFKFPDVLSARPVVKIVGGKNTYGHSAPFPPPVPAVILDRMSAGSTVLDPYAGSLTTSRVAYAKGIASVAIELHEHYCCLAKQMIESECSATLFEVSSL